MPYSVFAHIFFRWLTVFESPSLRWSLASARLPAFRLRSARFWEISGGGGGGAFIFPLHLRWTSRLLAVGAPLHITTPLRVFYAVLVRATSSPLVGWCRCVVAPLAAIFDSPLLVCLYGTRWRLPWTPSAPCLPGDFERE